MHSPNIDVTIHLGRIRASAEAIRRATGVPLIAVIKADAYGLGAARVADALAGVADEFAYFALSEARALGRGGLVIGPPEGDPAEFRSRGLRPTLMSPRDADRFRDVPCAVSLDTGMQRFGCTRNELEQILPRCAVRDVFTHTQELGGVARLREAAAGRGVRLHAACSALLEAPEAWLDAVRPGYALYRGALRVSARLHDVRENRSGAFGYTGFAAPRVGIILAGYSNWLRPAPALVNGRRQRVLEVGMNSAFVSVDAADRAGDEAVLLGDGLTEEEVARDLGVRPHEVLCRYGCMAERRYRADDVLPSLER